VFSREDNHMNAKEPCAQLQVDDRIQVATRKETTLNHATCLSRVSDIESGDYLIEWPASKGSLFPVEDQDILLISFYVQGWVYCFEACVVAKNSGHIPLLKIRQINPTRRIQRRDYVRVPAAIEVVLNNRIVHTAIGESNPVDGPISISTRTVNLSGGGFAICHSNALPVGTIFDVKLNIPEGKEPLYVTAKVVRSQPLNAPTGEVVHDIGFAFVELVEVIRRPILSYVIRRQQSF
jgi:c-di-GMP-binding flagellar brake protein YcgR